MKPGLIISLGVAAFLIWCASAALRDYLFDAHFKGLSKGSSAATVVAILGTPDETWRGRTLTGHRLGPEETEYHYASAWGEWSPVCWIVQLDARGRVKHAALLMSP